MEITNSDAVERILKRARLEAESAGSFTVGVNHLIVGLTQEPAANDFFTQPPWEVDELRAGKRKSL